MKFLVIVSLSFVLMFFDCPSKKENAPNQEKQKTQAGENMNEFLSFENKVDGIKYKFKAKMKKAGSYNGVEYKNDFVEIEYDLNNTSGKDYVVFNKGHFGSNSYKVYVEGNKDGSVEISQKAFEEPKGKKCPDRFVAISPLASILKSSEKMANKIQFEMPLETRTPFDDCLPKGKLPKDIKELKFCIGVMEVNPSAISFADDGKVARVNSISEQKLLCSDAFALK